MISAVIRMVRKYLKQLAYIGIWLGALPLIAIIAALRTLRGEAAIPDFNREVKALSLVIPFPSGDKSGGSKAMQGLQVLLSSQYTMHLVKLHRIAHSRGWRTRAAEHLMSALPIANHCRAFLFSPKSVVEQLRTGTPVLIEFMSGSLFLFFGSSAPGPLILRDHEVLCRRQLESLSETDGPLDLLLAIVALAFTYCFTLGIYSRVHRIITLTKEDEAFLRRFYPSVRHKVETIPVPIQLPALPAEASCSSTQGATDLVMLANFYHRPNVDALLWFTQNCAPFLKRAYQLHLVGLDDVLDDVDFGSAPIPIIRHGYIDNVRKALPHARIAVGPVVSGGGVRIKNLYMAALGFAVVTTPRGNEGVGFTDSEAVVCASGSEMARAIDGLAAEPERICSMGRAARRKVVAEFSPKAVLSRYRSVIEPGV